MSATLESGAGPRTAPLRYVGDPAARPPELTVPQMFHHTAHHFQHKTALMHKDGGTWIPTTYHELEQKVQTFARGLIELGVAHGATVALLSENRPEWAITDLAVLAIGAVNAPLYPTLPPAQVEYIVSDSEARVLVVSSEKQLAKALEVRGRLPQIEHIILMDSMPELEVPAGVRTFEQISGLAARRSTEELEHRSHAVQPSDVASIIYTSGTTGNPKGAVLTHDNFMSNAQAAAEVCRISSTDLFLSFLPLSHVFERMAGHYFPLLMGATIAYAESIFAVSSNMAEVKPTIMASVPRLYESIESRIRDGVARRPPADRAKFERALEIGWKYHSARIANRRPDPITAILYAIADARALQPLRERITGGQLRYFISGGAPLPVATAKFITSLGLNILEGYGLTETAPVICVNRPTQRRLGTVGPVVPGVEVQIADDGEILSRGPHIMQGYYKQPEATAQAIDEEGWFHTGDIGELDADGLLKITDRKKDLLVLANGKNVAPQPIEAVLKSSPSISAVVLFGDRQPNVVALIVPDFDHLKRWAREQGIEGREPEELAQDSKVRRFYKEEIERLTPHLADFEKIRRFALLTREFSQDEGELTPTLKIKRRVVAEKHASVLQTLYGGRDS